MHKTKKGKVAGVFKPKNPTILQNNIYDIIAEKEKIVSMRTVHSIAFSKL